MAEGPMTLRKILLSPLVHFFALGALIFAAFAALDDEPVAPPPDEISLTPQEAVRLVQRFTAMFRIGIIPMPSQSTKSWSGTSTIITTRRCAATL